VFRELRAIFQPERLLSAVDFGEPCVPAMNFCASVLDISKSVTPEMLQAVLGLGFRVMKADPVPLARVVNATDPDDLRTFLCSLSESNVAKIRTALSELCPRVKWLRKTVPEFDPNDSGWAKKLREFIETVAAQDWQDLRDALFENLNRALFDEAIVPDALKIILQMFQQFGIEGYRQLIPGLSLNLRGPWAKHVEAIVGLVLSTAPLPDVFLAFEDGFADANQKIAQNSLDFIRLLVQGLTATALQPIVDPLATALTPQLEHKDPLIRKSVVYCFVALKIAVGSTLDAHLANLTKPQRRLIGIYFNKGKLST
jgi:hypothetical protein